MNFIFVCRENPAEKLPKVAFTEHNHNANEVGLCLVAM